MSGTLRDFDIVREPAEIGEIVPIVALLLRRASRVLDHDAPAARREIQRALDMLWSAGAETTDAQPSAPRRPRSALAPWQAQRVVDHIHAHLETPMRVEDMAGVTRLSASYFFRAFRRSFGRSPHAYVVALRLARALALLMESDEPLSRIAATCGFADQAHFSRVFRREVGSAPGVWRREQYGLRVTDRAAASGNGANCEA